MFGLNEQEAELYKDAMQDYAVREITPAIVSKSSFIVPALDEYADKIEPDSEFAKTLLNDIELIITQTTTHIAYDYANMQCDESLGEEEILRKLHNKYESYVMSQFIKFGITFTTESLRDIVGEIIIELPYIYSASVTSPDFDEVKFFEDKMGAYEKYIEENFPDIDYEADMGMGMYEDFFDEDGNPYEDEED